MKLSDSDILRRLGTGESIANVCAAADMSRSQFDAWWQGTIASRVPSTDGSNPAHLEAPVSIERDSLGIPHIFADNDRDLFFGYGVAISQDRLFQLDYLRRKGHGRLAEILGPDGLPLDTIARTVGFSQIALAEWDKLESRVRELVEAFSAGVNHVIARSANNLPVEFDLLDYRPDSWYPTDCLVIESEFRWYLTGRLPIIAIPELAKRKLGDGALYEQFILGEADEESILQSGEYDPGATGGSVDPVGHVMNDPDGAVGSNNWVLSGVRTTTDRPLIGSDPHIAFEAVSCWHEVHLCGGSFHVAGMAYVGIPAVMIGRNERVAWGITNNICSLRDLYQEQTDQRHPGCFLYDGNWEPERQRHETIHVKDNNPVEQTIRFSRNGPIVDELLPPEIQFTGPVSLKWLGASKGGWLTAMLDMDRTENVAEFREALRPWHVPTFSVVIADVDGSIAFHATGRIPVRDRLERGYRHGWDPAQQWQGVMDFESMPAVVDPERGWIGTANNRVAPDDYPRKLFGCWSSGWRSRRIRQMIEAHPLCSPADIKAMHQDTKSLRAEEVIPVLLQSLEDHSVSRVQDAVAVLRYWDFHCEVDSRAASIFNVFFTCWCRAVARTRFDEELVDLISEAIAGCASRLLAADPAGWFEDVNRRQLIVDTFEEALDVLTARFGADPEQWAWGNLHLMPLRHVLSARGELGQLLDHGDAGVKGESTTVCNTGSGPEWSAKTGAGYRFVSDLSRDPPVLMAVDGQSQSGHPGSLHYGDQHATWRAGDYHEIPLVRESIGELCAAKLTLQPH